MELTFPASLYKDWDRLPKYVHCDNVVNFLTLAGYKAIVPGREDFLYGAWWLDTIACLLQERNQNITTSDPGHAGRKLYPGVELTGIFWGFSALPMSRFALAKG